MSFFAHTRTSVDSMAAHESSNVGMSDFYMHNVHIKSSPYFGNHFILRSFDKNDKSIVTEISSAGDKLKARQGYKVNSLNPSLCIILLNMQCYLHIVFREPILAAFTIWGGGEGEQKKKSPIVTVTYHNKLGLGSQRYTFVCLCLFLSFLWGMLEKLVGSGIEFLTTYFPFPV